MGICTRCGTLMNDEDMYTHVCNPNEIPDKGKPIKKGDKKQVV